MTQSSLIEFLKSKGYTITTDKICTCASKAWEDSEILNSMAEPTVYFCEFRIWDSGVVSRDLYVEGDRQGDNLTYLLEELEINNGMLISTTNLGY
jgi:hypothetical protein